MRAVEKVQGRSHKKLASETYVIRTRASFLNGMVLIFFYSLKRYYRICLELPTRSLRATKGGTNDTQV